MPILDCGETTEDLGLRKSDFTHFDDSSTLLTILREVYETLRFRCEQWKNTVKKPRKKQAKKRKTKSQQGSDEEVIDMTGKSVKVTKSKRQKTSKSVKKDENGMSQRMDVMEKSLVKIMQMLKANASPSSSSNA